MSVATSNLEHRVATLEAELAQLKLLVNGTKTSRKPWWEEIAGTFANDPAYEEAMRLGREYRESLRPKPPKKRRKKDVHSRH